MISGHRHKEELNNGGGVAHMASYKDLVKNHFDTKGIKYLEPKDDVLIVPYSADNLNEMKVIIDFDSDEGKAEFVCLDIGQFADDQFAKGLIACNTCNTKFRWTKFYIDEEGHVLVRADAILDEETCGEECLEMVQRMVHIIDEAYPVFMKARWA
jgi:hypothetical protein